MAIILVKKSTAVNLLRVLKSSEVIYVQWLVCIKVQIAEVCGESCLHRSGMDQSIGHDMMCLF